MDMKSFENCNVAVCFSGQSRTFKYCAESINNFFSSNRGNKFYFFGHTTNINLYKKNLAEYDLSQNETLDKNKLKQDLESVIDFKKLLVEEEIPHPIHFGPQLYSLMKSNFLKQQYELENNMMFDLVIRSRFDLCYPHNSKFEDHINFLIEEKTLYANYGIMRGEFFMPNPDEIFHFGSSLTMDLVDSIYNVLVTGSFHRSMQHTQFNPAWKLVSTGPLIYKWCSMKNILPKQTYIPFAVVRKQSIDLDYKTDWDKMLKLSGFME